MNTQMQSTRPARSAGSNVSQGRDPAKHAAADITQRRIWPGCDIPKGTIRKGLDEGLLKTDPINVHERRCWSRYFQGYSVSGVESRHAIKQMVDSRKGATCEMSVAGLALPVVQQPAAAVTRGEKMERLMGGDSHPLEREPDKKRRLVMPSRRSSARPHL